MSYLSHLEHYEGVSLVSPIRMVLSEDMYGLRFLQEPGAERLSKCKEEFLMNVYQAVSH
jgi:hypothetical protein